MYLSLSLGMNRDSRDDEECVELERIFGIILGIDVVKWVKIRDGILDGSGF